MKYDRPVWQIMHECADAMPAVFRYDDVRNWFDQHYPDVNEATIRAHLIGLTEGGRTKHVQFAPRSPVFRRVARGEYEAIPLTERGEDPHAPAPTSQIKMSGTIKMSGNGHHPAPSIPSARSDDERLGAADIAVADIPSDDEEEPRQPDIILLGSIGERVNVPAPAKEVFREVEFQRSRRHAELSGSQWFILSAEHGLVAPNEWMSPDSRTLADMDPAYRVAWASWVVSRLESLIGSLDDLVVRIDAPDVFTGPLFSDLQDAGAVVSSGTVAVVRRPQSDWQPERTPPAESEERARQEPEREYRTRPVPRPEPEERARPEPEPHPEPHPEPQWTPRPKPEYNWRPDPEPSQQVRPEPVPERRPAPAPTREPAPEPVPQPAAVEPAPTPQVREPEPELATVTDIDTRSAVSAHLAAAKNAVPATDVSSLPQTPGLYGWLVDPVGARALNRCLKLPVAPGLIFVGQVGGSSWHSLTDPVLNVRDHVDRVQLHGRTRASTFRMTLATVLSGYLGMSSLEDAKLTVWMLEHLSVTAWGVSEGESLRELTQLVISELDPPLNVDHLPATEYRARLQQMREALA